MSEKLSERLDEFRCIDYDYDENPVDDVDLMKLADEIRKIELENAALRERVAALEPVDAFKVEATGSYKIYLAYAMPKRRWKEEWALLAYVNGQWEDANHQSEKYETPRLLWQLPQIDYSQQMGRTADGTVVNVEQFQSRIDNTPPEDTK